MLDFAGRKAGYSKSKIRENRKNIVLDIFRMKEKRLRMMRELSQGEQKKSLMMMEFMAAVGNLLLTDPLDNLDTFSAKRFQTFLHLLREHNVEFFSVSV